MWSSDLCLIVIRTSDISLLAVSNSTARCMAWWKSSLIHCCCTELVWCTVRTASSREMYKWEERRNNDRGKPWSISIPALSFNSTWARFVWQGNHICFIGPTFNSAAVSSVSPKHTSACEYMRLTRGLARIPSWSLEIQNQIWMNSTHYYCCDHGQHHWLGWRKKCHKHPATKYLD